jgi:hypothetical protein
MPNWRGQFRPGRIAAAVVALLIAIAAARVIATYRVFNATSDSPAHISPGMEWLQFGRYTYEPLHPPLARVAVALGPYLKGLRSETPRDPRREGPLATYDEGNRLLYSDGDYWTNLALSRAGVLPFLAALLIAVYLWCRRYATIGAGLWAVLLLSTAPPVLGHAGVATLDVACAATVFIALYQFTRWIETPTGRRAAWLGAAVAVAFLTKLSAVAFLAACAAAAWVVCRNRRAELPPIPWRRSAAAALAAGFLVLWAGYRFSLVPLTEITGEHPGIENFVAGKPVLEWAWRKLLTTPLPLTEFAAGLRDLVHYSSLGQESYLFGEVRTRGWWYFFPVVLAFKTPSGLLFLTLAGAGLVLARWRAASWPLLLTLAFALAILAVSMASTINLGVRHILPIYPLFAILAAHAMVTALRSRRAVAAAALALAAWAVVRSAAAHPDYLAHFNILAGPEPERILVESDLDWGQDLARLSRRLRELGADHVSIAYFGSAPLDKAGLPPYRVLGEQEPLPGYIAVSVRYLNMEFAKNGGYAWLRRYMPVERVGRSIYLYYLETIP